MEENWLVYVNGEMVPAREAKSSVFDRAFQYPRPGPFLHHPQRW